MKDIQSRLTNWKQTVACFVALGAVFAFVIEEASAQRGRGGGGRGGGGMRSGGASHSRSPSMSRPSTPSRPSTSRPSTQRPSTQRPSTNRPNVNPGTNRPGTGARPGTGQNRPGNLQGNQPSRSELSNFLNLDSGAGNRAQAGNRAGERPAGANDAVADFLNHNPSTQNANRESVAQNRSDNISNRTDARSDVRDSRGENREFASDNRQDRVSDRGDRQSGRVENRGEMRSDLAAGRADRRTERQEIRGERADEIRDHMNEHYDHDHLFDDFWSNHPHAHYHFHQNPVFWTWATVNTVQAFLPWNWGTGGGGGGYYYDDGTVYSGEEQYPAEEYAAEAEEIVASAPEVENVDDMEWLPLGVFALTDGKSADTIPNMFLQLAISKEGILAGTYQNKATGETESVEGMVDAESKRAAWTIVGQSSPILETMIDGLTQNETNVLVHFADGTTQEWLMLHVENPDATTAEN